MLKLSIMLILISFFFILISLNIRSQSGVKEYELNKYLKLKLENGQTNIYVNNKHFRQCLYLLLNINSTNLEDYEDVNSIDEAADKLDGSMERDFNVRNSIGSETEFWGHCSNLQAWVENDYDTRILHRNLAFPLLKKLVEIGDPKAKRVFKEEIAIRVASRHPSVINYLIQEGFLKFLSSNELESIFEDIELEFFKNPIDELVRMFRNIEHPSIRRISRILNQIFDKFNMKQIPFIFSKIKSQIPKIKETLIPMIFNIYKSKKGFPKVDFINNNIEYFDLKEYNLIHYENRIIGIKQNRKISLRNKNISRIDKIKGLEDIYDEVIELDLSENYISDLHGIECFSNVKILNLNNNELENINGLKNLKYIECLSLRKNKIEDLQDIKAFLFLKRIDLSDNFQIEEVPKILSQLPNLEFVKLWNCNIKRFDISVEKYFWGNQNYRYFKGFNQHVFSYYESTHSGSSRSPVDGGLYKDFVRWGLKMKKLQKKYNFTFKDIHKFEETTQNKGIWGGKVTKAFQKWLFDKSQTQITDYF
jgi:hypothetical protein